MNLFLILLGFSFFMDYPVYSEPVTVTSAIIDDIGTIKCDLLFHYTAAESLTTFSFPLYLRFVPVADTRFGFRFPSLWQRPDGQAIRLGVGNFGIDGARQLFSGFGDFLTVGGEITFPTAVSLSKTDTIHPDDRKLRFRPYVADAYVWRFLALFVDLGLSVPVYDARDNRFGVSVEAFVCRVALRARPIPAIGAGVEFHNRPAAMIPACTIHLGEVWNADLGVVLSLTARSERTVIAGFRFRL